MARRPNPLSVCITPIAMRDLIAIWESNAEAYSADHAEAYVLFLREEAYQLPQRTSGIKPVLGAPEFGYFTVRKNKRRGSHGHVIVFQILGDTIEVLRFFHTRQDWPRTLQSESK